MVKDWVSVMNLMNPIMKYMLICCICALYRCSKLIICELYKCDRTHRMWYMATVRTSMVMPGTSVCEIP